MKQVRRLQAENRELKCRLAQCENDHRQSASKSTSSSGTTWLANGISLCNAILEDGKLSNRSDAETQTFADADEVQECVIAKCAWATNDIYRPPAKRRRSSGYQAESTVREVEHPIEQLLAVVEEVCTTPVNVSGRGNLSQAPF